MVAHKIQQLFTAILDAGVTVVATSNRPPVDLYKNGLNREHFLPFIALIEDRLDVLSLNGPTDYRRDRLGNTALWHVPADAAATQALSAAFFASPTIRWRMRRTSSLDLDVGGGRTLHVPKALKGVAVFSVQTAVRRTARARRTISPSPARFIP